MTKKSLRLVHPEQVPAGTKVSGVTVDFSLKGDRLVVSFVVRDAGEPFLNPALPSNQSAWGLWDWDVVEVFVRANSSAAYYEFELSPLGQFLELEIFEPRKRVNRDFVSGFEHEVERLKGGWRAWMELPLAKLGWDGRPESIVGNAFAILGEGAGRTYWSLFLEQQQTPDFHLPERFSPLLPD